MLKSITAVTEVYPDGQKCVRGVLEYDEELDAASVDTDTFEVRNRTITEVTLDETGTKIILSFHVDDAEARTFFPGEPFAMIPAKLKKAELVVTQKKEIRSKDGSIILDTKEKKSDRAEDALTDQFVQGSYQGLDYNLYIPENYDPSVKYPLVQFIHDAAICCDDVKAALCQGIGALVWMRKEEQKKRPCFVLVPQFHLPTIVDDDWNVDHRLEVAKKLLDQIVSLYSIDTDRIYTTGQSMGCMSSMVLNLRYPDLFAASLFVAGQWDDRLFVGSHLEKKPFWFINSQGDAKAFPGMNQILVALEQDGAKVARDVWEAKESQEYYAEKTTELKKTGADMIYTPFEMTTIANGWHSNGGEHHVNTWRYAYDIEAIREWLFEQHR